MREEVNNILWNLCMHELFKKVLPYKMLWCAMFSIVFSCIVHQFRPTLKQIYVNMI